MRILRIAIPFGSIVSLAASVCLADVALPATRPADFAISVYASGGMLPLSSRIECSAAGCHATWYRGPRTTEDQHAVTAAQLDVLYAAVRAQRFDHIRRVSHGTVRDAGGTNVRVLANAHTWSIGPDATHNVAPGDVRRFQAVVDAVGALLGELRTRDHWHDPSAPSTGDVNDGF